MNWVQRRNRFQHDWLKNRYILQLGRYLNVLDELIEDPKFEARFLSDVLPDWPLHRQEVLDLASDYIRSMSPSVCFGEFPLNELPPDVRSWLGETVDLLWQARYPIESWRRACIEAVAAVDTAYDDVLATKEGSRISRDRTAKLADSCRALARTVAQFPCNIRII